jgi:hypothetical protein
MNEKAFCDEIFTILEPAFVIHRQVGGTHFTGAQFWLDAVVTPRDPTLWKNPKVALGIEFKDVVRLRGDTNNFTKWLAQCVDYSNTRWDRFGYIFIFACPSLVEDIPAGHSRNDVVRVLNAVMGQLGIGELRNVQHHGWSFILHNQHRIWSYSRGVEEGCRYTLERRFGSR